ncbi:Retinol dehydrogenase 12, partial [Orchesella cincta]
YLKLIMAVKNLPVSPSVPPGSWFVRFYTWVLYDCIHWGLVLCIAAWQQFTTSPPILDIDNLAKRTGNVAVLTGGPRGIALGMLKRLVQLDFTIVIGARDIKDSQRRVDEFANSNPDLSCSKVTIFEMDLMSLASVRKFADNVMGNFSRIDLLLCNAAVIKTPYQVTEDGFESQFQANYLSNFLLTDLLLNRLKATAKMKGSPCQIIYSSSLIYPFGKVDFKELETSTVYTPVKAYIPTKLYQVMSMLSLEKKLLGDDAQVHCYAVHPGLVLTDMANTLPVMSIITKRLSGLFRTIQQGADTILWPAFCADYQNRGGLYMESGMSQPIAKIALDKEVQSNLFARSQELIAPVISSK